MNWKKTAIVCFVVLSGGVAITALIFTTEPTAKRTGAVKETAMLVDVVAVERGTYRPLVVATGIVEPSKDILLSPRVDGEIVARSPAFTPGGHVERGDTLLQIDPSDYRNALAQRRSELNQAMADLQMEMGRQNVAEQDYALLDDSVPDEQKDLVLRKPQLNAARSRVESARAAVEQAELHLKRTTITAPFDAHILSRNANVGSQVSAGDALGRLVGVDSYWVVLTVPLAKIRWLDIPTTGEATGSMVTIRNRTAWEEGESREGRLYRLVGALEDNTRMARLLVTVDDPLGYRDGTDAGPPLMIGSFVEATVEGREIRDVVRLDRDYVRADDTAWVVEGDSLRVRDVDIVMRDAVHAYVRSGLEDGDRVVTTNLSTVRDGAPLRLK